MAISPTTEGFRVAFRCPSLTFAEIAWRWTSGATAAALVAFGLVEYLDTLPVTNGELLFLRTRQPYLVSEAIAHILRGSLNRAVLASVVAVLLLTVLWIVAASVGRIATVRALLDHFRRDLTGKVSADSSVNAGETDIRSLSNNGRPLATLLRLNFLRAAVALAAVLGFLAASILAGFASSNANPRPALALFIFLPLCLLICLVWSTLNWLLSLAGMFAVRDDEDAVGAIGAVMAFCRERTGPVFVVSIWTGMAHLVLFVAATTVASMPLGFVAVVPWRLVVVAIILTTLLYFALADWLYMARLAGYVCIAEMPEALLKWAMPSQLSTFPPVAPPTAHASIDRDELILSDRPEPSPSAVAALDSKRVSDFVEQELSKIGDPELSSRIRELLVSPYPVERAWDYGLPDEHFTCWTVLEHPATNVGIAYCGQGFGPKCPWGLVFLSGPHMSIGMDSGWFASLQAAMRDSVAWDDGTQ